MSSTEISVTTNVSDAVSLSSVLTLAFAADPFARWLFPDPDAFLRFFPRLSRLHARTVAPHGGAIARTDGLGAALWYPPGVRPEGSSLEELFTEAGVLDRLNRVFEETHQYEPTRPHWYLRQIGVDPLHQGKGLGGPLLAAGLTRADEDSAPAYLEATSSPGRDFYLRYGFVELAEVSVDGSASLWLMRREPR